jgi:hypothetical protein
MLALNGSKDVQVLSKPNLERMKSLVRNGQPLNLTVVEIPNLNHFFQTCKTGSVEEYEKISETFSPAALETIGNWLLNLFKR